jgi:chemotaxis protein CheX
MNPNIVVDHSEVAEYIKLATGEVFSQMLGMTPQAAEASQMEGPWPAGNGVVAVVGIAGDWSGAGTISSSTALACQIASAMLMAPYYSIDDDVLDAFAEVANMIVGNVKTHLEDRIGPLGLSIPTVVHGHNFQSRTVTSQSWTVVPFTVDGERFEVHVCLAPQKRSAIAGHRLHMSLA